MLTRFSIHGSGSGYNSPKAATFSSLNIKFHPVNEDNT